MSKTLRELLIERLEEYREAPIEETRQELSNKYPDITLEDAKRIKDGLLSTLDAPSKAEQDQRQREYKALHDEMKRKYKKKSGSK